MSRRRRALTTRRDALALLLGACGAPLAHALDSHPPLRVLVPGSAGSALDQFARRLSDAVSAALGQPVVVDNRPGGNGLIGAQAAAEAPGDGNHCFIAGLNVLAINPALYATLRYDPRRSFVPVTLIARGSPLLLAAPELPVRTLPELLARARGREAPLRHGAPGVGTVQHLASRLLEQRTGLKLLQAQYSAPPQAMADLMAGHLDLAVEFSAVALPLVQAGRLRALAVLGPQRHAGLPDVPTAAEFGVGELDATAWVALLAPAGTPPDAVRRLARAWHAAMAAPAFVQWVRDVGSEVQPGTPDSLGQLIDTELLRWARIVAASGAKIE